MDELNAKLRKFFDSYESANADFEVEKIASFYAEVFMFGDPQGVRCVRKEDFVRVLPKRKEFFQSLGLVSSKIEALRLLSWIRSTLYRKQSGRCGSSAVQAHL